MSDEQSGTPSSVDEEEAAPTTQSSAQMATASPSDSAIRTPSDSAVRSPRKSAPTLNDSPAARKAAQRVRMALRIPDDEVSRPSEPPRPSAPSAPAMATPVAPSEPSLPAEKSPDSVRAKTPSRPSERAKRVAPSIEIAPESGEPIEVDEAATLRGKQPPPPPTLRQGSRPSFPPASSGSIKVTGPSSVSTASAASTTVDASSMREMRAAEPVAPTPIRPSPAAFPPEAKTAPATPEAPREPRERMNAFSEEAGSVDVRFDDDVPSQPTTRSSAPDIEPEDLLAVVPPVPAKDVLRSTGSGTHPADVRPPASSQMRIATPSGTSPIAPPPLTGEPREKKRGKPWWEELFNDDYLRTMNKITDAQIAKEVTFIEESLAVQKGANLLDLACGTGRHAIELARRGYEVVGYDLSLAMLARAAEEASEREQKLNFVQGDMREMAFDEVFDGIYCWNTSFGFFEEEKNAQIVGKVHRALKSGGQFLLDVTNRDFIGRQAPSLAWFEGEGCMCMDEMTIDWVTSRMRVKRTMMMDDGRTKEIEYSVRVYSLHELGKLLHDHGFRVAEVSGRPATPGVFFGAESPRTLILAEKR
ncbi:MAG: methyltransferase domain-containing protein [Polyangiaceae bacterium]